MKRLLTIISIFFLICLFQSCDVMYYPTGYNNNSYQTDAYSTPVQPSSGACAVCGGRGYITRNGQKETCGPCGGTGKAVAFPDKK